jgi:hypothetical protein
MPTTMDFADLIGTWAGPSSLWMEPGTPAHESTSSATVRTVAGGKILMVEYTWTFEGAPHDGTMLIATDGGVHISWCDSFHMDRKIMELDGAPGGAVLAATGSYALPDAEPWGWRIELELLTAEHLQLRMFNILPASMGGIEAVAVQADYARA